MEKESSPYFNATGRALANKFYLYTFHHGHHEPYVQEKTSLMEEERVSNFFQLLHRIKKDNLHLTPSEWLLTCHCLDELNHRRGDMTFLCAAAFSFMCQKRTTSRRMKWFTSFYIGLVAYDLSLQQRIIAPATVYWTSIATLDSDLGRAARKLYTPPCYYAANYSVADSLSLVQLLARSLFLKTWFKSIFYGSCSNVSLPDGTHMSRLIASSRFLRWNMAQVISDNGGNHFVIGVHPGIYVDKTLLHSYQYRDVFLPETSAVGRWWYKLHFSIISGLGL